MNKKHAISWFFAGFLAGALIATGLLSWVMRSGPEGGAETVLKLGHSLDQTHPVHTAMEYMKKRLVKHSRGTMTLDIYPGGVIGSETQCIEMLQNGALSMTKTSASPLEGFIPEMAIFSLPYIFRDRDHFWKVLDSPVGRELLRKAEGKNLRGLCYYDSGSRNFYTVKKPILHPDDLEGMKIRVMNSRTAMNMITNLGGAPTPIAWGELYTALQQGTVDGAENNPPSFYTNKHYEVCPHLSMDHHTRIPDILMVSIVTWERLTPEQREWLQKAADESSLFQRDLWVKKTSESLEAVKKEGVTVYNPDIAPFREEVKPMLQWYRQGAVGDLMNKIDGM